MRLGECMAASSVASISFEVTRYDCQIVSGRDSGPVRGDQGGADRAGAPAEAGQLDGDRVAQLGVDHHPWIGRANRLDQGLAEVGESAADDDSRRVEDLHQAGQAHRGPVRELGEHREGGGVAARDELSRVLAGHVLGRCAGEREQRVGAARRGRLARQAPEGRPGRVALLGPAAPAHAGDPVVHDGHVTGLTGEAGGAW